MNSQEFKEFYKKLNHELMRFDFTNRLLNVYFFKRDDKFLALDFDILLSVQIYTKVYNDKGIAIDLNYLYNSAYKLTTSQTMKVKKLIDSLINV